MSSHLLENLKIIEIGNGYTSAIAGMMFADYGAQVIQIQTDEETSLAPHVALVLNHKKEIHSSNLTELLATDSLQELLNSADICIESVQSEISEQIATITKENKTLIHCKMPMFPKGHPHEQWPVSEESIAATTTLFEPPLSLGKPKQFYFPIVSYMTASFSINGIMMALHARLRDGRGQKIILPHYDVGFYANMLIAISLHNAPSNWEVLKMLGSPFIDIWPTSDESYIYLHIGISRHLPLFLETLQKNGMALEAEKIRNTLSEQTKHDTTDFPNVKEAKSVYKILSPLIASKPAEYWEELLGSNGICCNKIRNLEEWIETDYFAAISQKVVINGRNMIVPKPIASVNGELPEPSSTKREEKQTPPPITEKSNTTAPLSGVRVIDMARVVAGPLGGKVLTDAGAEVMQVWKPGNLQHWEVAMYMLFNGGKKSLQVNLKEKEGKQNFETILKDFKPHIVLHNYTPEAAKRVGLDFETLKTKSPNIIFMNVTAFNQRSNFAKRRGFEQNIQAISGVQMEIAEEGVPQLLTVMLNDVNTGCNASFAIQAALYAQKQGRNEAMHLHTSLDTPALLAQLEKINKPNKEEQAFIDDRNSRNRFFKAKDKEFFLSCDAKAFPTLLEKVGAKEAMESYFANYKVKDIITQFNNNVDIRIIPRRKFNDFVEEMLKREKPGAVRHWSKGTGWYTELYIPIDLSRTPLIKPGAAVPLGTHTEEILKGNYDWQPPKEVASPDKKSILNKIKELFKLIRGVRWVIFKKRRI